MRVQPTGTRLGHAEETRRQRGGWAGGGVRDRGGAGGGRFHELRRGQVRRRAATGEGVQHHQEAIRRGFATMSAVRDTERAEPVRLVAIVHGRVQGVGFRWWTRRRAIELRLTGHARNLADGRVEVVAEGPRPDCERLLTLLRSGSTPGKVDRVAPRWVAATGQETGFVEC